MFMLNKRKKRKNNNETLTMCSTSDLLSLHPPATLTVRHRNNGYRDKIKNAGM